MKILITGATGFLGSHLYEGALSDGIDSIGLARSSKKWQEFQLPGEPLIGDLSEESISEWIEKLPDDLTHVIHTAGIVHSFDKLIFQKINTLATIDLFKKLTKKYPKLHFVFISSLAAVGPSLPNIPHDEMTSLNPTSLYGKSKREAEDFLKQNLPPKWSLTIIRPPMVIGPRDPAVLDIFKMVKGRLVLQTGFRGTKKLYSFVCVHDVVGIIKESLKKDHQNLAVYFPSYPTDHSFGEIIEVISQQMGKKPFFLPIPFPAISALAHSMAFLRKFFPIELRLTPDKLHELKPQAWTCSGEKANSELGYQYLWSLEKTVAATLEDYQKRKWL